MAEITIRHRRSNQEGKVPTTGQLTLGELAVNTWDGRIFLKTNRDGFEEVVEFATVGIGNTTVLFADVQNKPIDILRVVRDILCSQGCNCTVNSKVSSTYI